MQFSCANFVLVSLQKTPFFFLNNSSRGSVDNVSSVVFSRFVFLWSMFSHGNRTESTKVQVGWWQRGTRSMDTCVIPPRTGQSGKKGHKRWHTVVQIMFDTL